MRTLSLHGARGLALAAQRLLAPPAAAPTKDALPPLIEQLGCLQIDTISVVARTQYLVPWSRLGRYDPAWLDQLLYPDRAIFEYWAHAASLLPTSAYRYYRPDMLAWETTGWGANRRWAEEHADLLRHVLDTISQAGALSSSAFEGPREGGSGPWGSWYGKESRRALEILWSMGQLMVDRRRGGQKLYDLRERVAPQPDESVPSPEERDRFFALRSARALGVATPSWLPDYLRRRWTRRQARHLLEGLAAEGLLDEVALEGHADPAFVPRELIPLATNLEAGLVAATRTTLLSPFDNLIWDRGRTRALFGYDYRLEAYTPAAQRRYGYYSLTILHRGVLVGRLDPKMERKERRLLVRSLHLEPLVSADAALVADLAASLADLATFLGAQHIELAPSPAQAWAELAVEARSHLRR